MYDPTEGGANRGLPIKQYLQDQKAIEIAVVWNSKIGQSQFWQGARLAAKEINSLPSTHFPRIQLNEIDSRPYLEQFHFNRSDEGRYRNASQLAAKSLADDVLANNQNVAVVGHAYGDGTAKNALLRYERAGILFLSSATASDRITSLEAPLAFALFPTQEALAARSARFLEVQGVDRLILIQERSGLMAGEDPAPHFLKALAHEGIKDAEVLSFKSKRGDRTATVARVTEELISRIDKGDSRVGIVILTQQKLAQLIYRQLEILDLKPTILTVTRTDNGDLAGGYEGFTFVDIFAPDRSYLAGQFTQEFKKHSPGNQPTNYAAVGYDHIKFLYQAMMCAGTTDPGTVALTIRYHMPIWRGVTGPFSFMRSSENLFQSNIIFRQYQKKDGKIQAVTLDL